MYFKCIFIFFRIICYDLFIYKYKYKFFNGLFKNKKKLLLKYYSVQTELQRSMVFAIFIFTCIIFQTNSLILNGVLHSTNVSVKLIVLVINLFFWNFRIGNSWESFALCLTVEMWHISLVIQYLTIIRIYFSIMTLSGPLSIKTKKWLG